MTRPRPDGAPRWMVLLAIVLGAVALLLFLVEQLATSASLSVPGGRPTVGAEQTELQEVIDTLLGRHGIPKSAVRTWRVLSADKKPIRLEQRVAVPRDFPSLVFNAELNQGLAKVGAHVVATERTREQTVTMHIVHRGMTVRSIAFVTATGS